MKAFSYDLVVIGAGSGGYAAARTARALGARVALVDHGPLGGLCILRGCMPSKTLLASSDAAHEVRAAAKLGVHAGEPRIDLDFIMRRKAEIIAGFAAYRAEAIRSFDLYEGTARFASPSLLAVGSDVELHATSFVIATGSVVAPPVVPGLSDVGYIDSDAALDISRAPRSMIVLGGGYVGTELGQFFARIGVATTVLLRRDHLLSGEDADVGGALTAALRDEGMRIETGAQLLRVERQGEAKAVVYTRDGMEHTAVADEIFYALGRVPNVEGLNLEAAGIEAHPITGIDVALDLRTSNPQIFAVGDVTGRFLLVHVAIYQGEIAARNAIGNVSETADYSLVRAHTVFTDPQVAVVGETEKELTRTGVAYLAASYPFSDHGKAISIGRTTGFVKMLASPVDGKILGAAVVGAQASELIHEIIVAMSYGANVFDFIKIPHLHPTLAEIWTYPAEELAERITTRGEVAV